MTTAAVASLVRPLPARAAEDDDEDTVNTPQAKKRKTRPTLESYLYRVLRAREATTQERRLITTGKFQDVQRTNVKLAVGFIVANYRLGDAVNGAAAYLSSRQMAAVDAGQAAVQNLQTILEYFDSSDVQNIKVSEELDAKCRSIQLFVFIDPHVEDCTLYNNMRAYKIRIETRSLLTPCFASGHGLADYLFLVDVRSIFKYNFRLDQIPWPARKLWCLRDLRPRSSSLMNS